MNQPSGFTYQRNKDATVVVFHHGRRAAVLGRAEGGKFMEEIAGLVELEAQHLMARLTGNYKRGNERLAKAHPRNWD